MIVVGLQMNTSALVAALRVLGSLVTSRPIGDRAKKILARQGVENVSCMYVGAAATLRLGNGVSALFYLRSYG